MVTPLYSIHKLCYVLDPRSLLILWLYRPLTERLWHPGRGRLLAPEQTSCRRPIWSGTADCDRMIDRK